MTKGKLRIAGAALNQTAIDWPGNKAHILEAIAQARAQKIDILCLPELCLTGYGCEDLFLSEWLPIKALELLMEIRSACQEVVVSLGLPIRIQDKLYNCCCLVQDGRILGFTAKQFLANDGVHYEPRWFSPWPAGQQITFSYQGENYVFGDVLYDVKGIKIGFEICEDAWRPQRPGIRHAQQGVDLILNPSASHFAFHKSKIRYNLVMGGAANFNCAYIYTDLLGNETGRMIYDGEVLISHHGKLIQRNDRLSFKDVNLVWADIHFGTGETSLEPLAEDQRELEYEFWEAITLGLFDYMRKSRSKGFVLSLSGGADSSACALMVSEMIKKGVAELGVEGFLTKAGRGELWPEIKKESSLSGQIKKITSHLLICAYQGTRNSGQETLDSARGLAESIGATFYHWTIDEEVEGYTSKVENALQRKLSWEQDDIALQNIQARSRSPIIWMLANIHNALLITTSNRSEGDVGYATMDGDTSGSLAPIAGVDKHFICHWLLWAEKNLDQPGLSFVNKLTPTAELRPLERVQTDEKDLMPYHVLVEIERLAIRDRLKPAQVYLTLKEKNLEEAPLLKAHIQKFYQLWVRNQWKRERIAPSFHIDTFNVDPRSWCRFPILSGGFAEELKELDTLE